MKAAATGNGLRTLRAGRVDLVDEDRATVAIRNGDATGYEELDVQRVGGRWLLTDADDGTFGTTYGLP